MQPCARAPPTGGEDSLTWACCGFVNNLHKPGSVMGTPASTRCRGGPAAEGASPPKYACGDAHDDIFPGSWWAAFRAWCAYRSGSRLAFHSRSVPLCGCWDAPRWRRGRRERWHFSGRARVGVGPPCALAALEIGRNKDASSARRGKVENDDNDG